MANANQLDDIETLLVRLREGDEDAAVQLWHRFFQQLMAQCRLRIRPMNTSVRDEEDIVLSAMKSFCLGLQRGRFPELKSEESLWRLLMTIVLRKIADNYQYQNRSKRDQSRTQSLSSSSDELEFSVLELSSRDQGPAIAAECSEQFRLLLDSLEHEDLRCVAIMKMEGFTNNEIATHIGVSLTSIERKLRTIRAIWSQP